MQLLHDIEEGICKVYVEGDIAMNAGTEMQAYLAPIFTMPEFKGLMINLSGVNMMDSRAIGTLTWVVNTLRDTDTKVALCGINSRVKMLLGMTQLDKIIPTYESEADARIYLGLEP